MARPWVLEKIIVGVSDLDHLLLPFLETLNMASTLQKAERSSFSQLQRTRYIV